eukprot:g11072.t1
MLPALSQDVEFQLKLQRCLSGALDPQTLTVDHGYLSDLLTISIRALRALHEGCSSGTSDTEQTVNRDTDLQQHFLSLFNLLATVFQHYIGPYFSSKARIFGLQSSEGLKLNDLVVEVAAFDVVSGRFCVKLAETDPKESWKRIKPENLQMLASKVNSKQEVGGFVVDQADHPPDVALKTRGTTTTTSEIKNVMGVNCLESVAEVFDFVLQELVHSREDALAQQLSYSLFRCVRFCLGRALTSTELFELSGRDVFIACTFAKNVLQGSSSGSGGSRTSTSSGSSFGGGLKNAAGCEVMRALAKLSGDSNAYHAGTGAGDALSNSEVEDGGLEHAENFRKKLTAAILDNDVLSCITNYAAAGVELGKGGAWEEGRRDLVLRLLSAGSAILSFLARRAVSDLKVRRHLMLHGNAFVTQVISRVLEREWGGAGSGGVNSTSPNSSSVSTLNTLLDGLCRLKVVLPHLLSSAESEHLSASPTTTVSWGIPDWVPYSIPSGDGALIARTLFLTLASFQYEDADNAELLMQKLTEVETHAFFASPAAATAAEDPGNAPDAATKTTQSQEMVRYWGALRAYLGTASPGLLHARLTTVLRQRQAEGGEAGAFGGAGFGEETSGREQGDGAEDESDEEEDDDYAAAIKASLLPSAVLSEEQLYEDLGTYYEEQQAILLSIMLEQQKMWGEMPGDFYNDESNLFDGGADESTDQLGGGGGEEYDYTHGGDEGNLEAYHFPTTSKGGCTSSVDPFSAFGADDSYEDGDAPAGHVTVGGAGASEEVEGGTSRPARPSGSAKKKKEKREKKNRSAYLEQEDEQEVSPGGTTIGGKFTGDLPALPGMTAKAAGDAPGGGGANKSKDAKSSSSSSKGLSRARLQEIGIPLSQDRLASALKKVGDDQLSVVVPSLCCGIDGKLMGEPVFYTIKGAAADAKRLRLCFERETLELWARQMGKVCPVTGESIAGGGGGAVWISINRDQVLSGSVSVSGIHSSEWRAKSLS